MAAEVGLTERDVANAVLLSLSGSPPDSLVAGAVVRVAAARPAE